MQTDTLIIGASIAGLACAAALQQQGAGYIIIEKEQLVATPWRNHYNRLHLHTNKHLSNLPYKKFGSAIPRYPSRHATTPLQVKWYNGSYIRIPVVNSHRMIISRRNQSSDD